VRHEILGKNLRGYGCNHGTLLYFWRIPESMGKEERFTQNIKDLMDINADSETQSLRLDFRSGDSLVIREMHPVELLNHVRSLKHYVYMYQDA